MAGYKRRSSKPSKPKKDMFEEATKNMLEIMKQGDLPWSKGRLQLGAAGPSNFNTGKRYRGINVLNLMCIGMMTGMKSNYFITYNQALKVAGVDRKDPEIKDKSPLTGQKAVGHVTYWGNITKDKDGKTWYTMENGRKRTQPTPQEIKAQGLKQIWFLRDTAVFAFEQMDQEKIPQAWLEKRNMAERTINKDALENQQDKKLQEHVTRMIKKMGVAVEHNKFTDTPYYSPSQDKIVMPPMNMYESDARYYSTLLHEACHATGHKSRLERPSLSNYSDDRKERAYEELVAELGGVFMALELGIKTVSSSELQNHASYVKGWGSLLSEDLASGNCTILNKACSDAEKAVEFMLNPPELKMGKKTPSKKPESEMRL